MVGVGVNATACAQTKADVRCRPGLGCACSISGPNVADCAVPVSATRVCAGFQILRKFWKTEVPFFQAGKDCGKMAF